MKPVRLASLLCLLFVTLGGAQSVDFPPVSDDTSLAAAMPRLAEQLIALHQDPDREKYLDALFRLQLVAGHVAEANETLTALREMQGRKPLDAAAAVRWEIYARAKSIQLAENSSFDDAFRRSFRDSLHSIDDRTAYRVLWSFGTSVNVLNASLQQALDQQKGKTTIPIADAVDLVRKYLGALAYRSFQPTIADLSEEDDRRRYVIEKDIRVRTPDGATVCASLVRPRVTDRLPALLNFTIYADPITTMNEARRTASNGYAGVEGLTRGKGCSPDVPVPYEHDGSDAAAVIDWIARQPWSDGRVGMYGGSYEGFTQWAAAKQMPKALKALMAGAPVAPGIDVPMEGNVFWNFVYPWPFYTTDNKTLDDATYNDNERWRRLNHQWYVSGRPYRELDKIDGTPNPVFHRWIDHPAYDVYWQRMIPYQGEFARIDIPVLTTAGYYYGGPGAALYYFTQHQKYRPGAEHYLLIGPYDHLRGHRGTVGILGNTMNVIAGYTLDPVAHLDMGELRYQWFDYLFKGRAKPALLQDRVNYEVMGANVWKHAPTVGAMADGKLRLHLTAARSGETYKLGERAHGKFVAQSVDFADRSDADRVVPGGGIVDKAIDTWNSVVFVSDPLTKTTEISGLFSGRLDLVVNKKDFDFSVAVYELTSAGDYVQLSLYWTRASYAADLSRRRLLTSGKRQRIDFQSIRLTSRQVEKGSRLVVLLSVIKDPGMQINYGSGKNVSDESIADAKSPLRIRWYDSSFVDIPVRSAR